MPSSTTAIDTPERYGTTKSRPVAAATKLFAGNLAALDAAGRAVPASDTAGLKVDGRVEVDVDNSGGAAGDLNVAIKHGVFRFANSGTDAIAITEIGKVVYVEDDHTVCKVGGANHVAAGICVDVDSQGVWVDTRLAPVAI